jgi:hypothetical protein
LVDLMKKTNTVKTEDLMTRDPWSV